MVADVSFEKKKTRSSAITKCERCSSNLMHAATMRTMIYDYMTTSNIILAFYAKQGEIDRVQMTCNQRILFNTVSLSRHREGYLPG